MVKITTHYEIIWKKKDETNVFVIGNSIFRKGERDCRNYIYLSIGKIHTL